MSLCGCYRKDIRWLDETPLPQYFNKLDKFTKDRRTQELVRHGHICTVYLLKLASVHATL